MSMDRISSVGINVNSVDVSSQTKSVRAQEKDIRVSDSGVERDYSEREQDKAGVLTDRGDISPDKVKSAVDDINKQIKSNLRRTQCSFKYHEDTNRISITVTDSDTHEVIREIPPEKALDMLAKAWELAGLMVDERR